MSSGSDSPPAEVAGPQVETAVTPPPGTGTTRVLDDARRSLLASALNRIIPARAGLPGAGDLDVGAGIEQSMAASTRLRRLFLDGLTEIELASERRHHQAFVDLDGALQVAVLKMVEQEWPAFFLALVEHAYRGYYTLPAVYRAIGYHGLPPQPLGRTLAPFDPAVLEQQRQRAPFWRHVAEPDRTSAANASVCPPLARHQHHLPL